MHDANRKARLFVEHDAVWITLVGTGEMVQLELRVGVALRGIGANVCMRGDTGDANHAILKERPAKCHLRLRPGTSQCLVERSKALYLHHQARMEVIAQILADTRQVLSDGNPVIVNRLRIADAGKLEQFGRLDRSGRENDLASCACFRALPARLVFNADRARSMKRMRVGCERASKRRFSRRIAGRK